MAGRTRRSRTIVAALAAATAMIVGVTMTGPLAAVPPEDVPEPPGIIIGTTTNAGEVTISFTSDIPGAAAFAVTTEHSQGSIELDAPPGTYTVTQLGPPPPYTFAGAFGHGCTLVGPQTFEVVVSADDVTTCFTVNQATALRMYSVALGGDGTFTYTTDIPGLPTFEVTTAGGQGEFDAAIPPGTWTITQQGPPDPFVLLEIKGCPPGPAPGSAIVTVAEGELQMCAFKNREAGPPITGPAVSGPFPAASSVPVSSLAPDGSPVGLGSPLPTATVPPGAPASLGTFGGISTENGGFTAPLDPTGDVGPNHYVQMVNTMFAVFAKDGTLLAGPLDINRLWDGAGGECEANNDGDPVVLYDQLADRWLLTQFSLGARTEGPYGMCVAVSQSGDPTGAYHLYELPSLWFNDYPKLGVWDDAYHLTTQPGGFFKADLYALDREAMLRGDPTRVISFSVNPTTFLLPPDLDGATPPPPGTPAWFTAYENPSTPVGGSPRLTVYALDADFADPASSTLELATEVPIAPFSPVCGDELSGSCVTAPETDVPLESLDEIPMFRAAYRSFGDQQTIVGSFAHGVGTADSPIAATRWWELRNTGGTWALHQEGNLTGGTLNRWTASAAQDRNGGLAVGYSASDRTTFPSIRYAARSPLDPLGAMGPEATMVEGGGSSTERGRWGDYSTLSIDPVDDCTFWYTNTYYQQTGVELSTAIGSFRRPDCAPVDLSLTKTASPAAVAPGGTIDYAIGYANAAGTASEVVLTETVPAGTTFAGGPGWTGCDVGAPAGSVCTLDIGGLAPGQSGTAAFSVRVDDAARVGAVVNEAVLSAGYGGGEVRATTTTSIGVPAAIAVVASPRFTG